VASATIALSAAVVLSIRARRRDLAVLRSLGFTASQVRGSVRVQSLVTMAVALVIGVPLGVAAGRIAWRAFADQLGVLTSPSTPAWWLGATVLGGVLIAVLAAAVPARLATAAAPSRTLRGE
jgi:putative ABC transport system permease protein